MNFKFNFLSFILIFLIVLVTILFLCFGISDNNNNITPQKNEEIKGYVKSIFRNKGSLTIKLYNSEKIYIYSSRNGLYKKICNEGSLYDFLKTNDSIYKPKGSDSLYIFRNNNIYYFVIGKFINE